jgi:hypothetical protein
MGYDDWIIPEGDADTPRSEKPVDNATALVASVLSRER